MSQLSDTWALFFHSVTDNKWDEDSYPVLYEFNTVEQFGQLTNTWKARLPAFKNGMFFLMKKNGDKHVYPIWENEYNIKGGVWSFKVEFGKNIWEAWKNICCLAIGNTLNQQNPSVINGISVSPKKNFVIIKIWMNSAIKDMHKLNPFVLSKSVIFKTHCKNIEKDKASRFHSKPRGRSRRDNSYGGSRSYGGHSSRYNKRSRKRSRY